ncbi:protein phosphatase, partial [Streptomyces rochei]
KLVEDTIVEGDLADARAKIEELAVQASACKKQAERRSAQTESDAKTGDEGQAGGTTGASPAAFTRATPSPSTSGTPKSPESSESPSTTAPTPGPGPTLSEEEQKVVSLCGKQ